MVDSITWSDWLDYSAQEISKIPTESGVYMMHAAMKILLIASSTNLRQAVLDSLNNSCTKDAKRFRFAMAGNHDAIKNQLLKEYQEKHEGKLPKCMN